MPRNPVKPHGPLYLLAGQSRHPRVGPDPLLAAVLAHLDIRSPRTAYIGAANGDDDEFFAMIKSVIVKAGAGVVKMVPLADGHPIKAKVVAELERADLIVMAGGDVEEGMRVLKSGGTDSLLRGLFDAGTPFLGLSAGSIMLAQAWVRWRDPADEASAERFPCLDFAPFLCDTHDEKSEWEELRTLLSLSPKGSVAYGIPADGALIVERDGSLSPCGRPVVRLA
ncbi:MAG: Type 1 glutamine amidotransferase-like domain-containing protein [Kiritimatiellia bacterium]